MLSPLSDHPIPIPIRFLHSSLTPSSSLVFLRHLVCCRRHNSYTILETTHNPIQLRQNPPESDQHEIRRRIINESSLATRRIPKFPGSVDFPKPDFPQVDFSIASFDSSVEQDRYSFTLITITMTVINAVTGTIHYSPNVLSIIFMYVVHTTMLSFPFLSLCYLSTHIPTLILTILFIYLFSNIFQGY